MHNGHCCLDLDFILRVCFTYRFHSSWSGILGNVFGTIDSFRKVTGVNREARFLEAHLVPVVLRFCELSFKELGAASPSHFNSQSRTDMLAEVLWRSLIIIGSCISHHPAPSRNSQQKPVGCSNHFLKSLGQGPTWQLAEKAVAILVLDDPQTTGPASDNICNLSLSTSGYIGSVIRCLVSYTLGLSDIAEQRRYQWTTSRSDEGIILGLVPDDWKLELLLDDPDPNYTVSTIASEATSLVSPPSTAQHCTAQHSTAPHLQNFTRRCGLGN